MFIMPLYMAWLCLAIFFVCLYSRICVRRTIERVCARKESMTPNYAYQWAPADELVI